MRHTRLHPLLAAVCVLALCGTLRGHAEPSGEELNLRVKGPDAQVEVVRSLAANLHARLEDLLGCPPQNQPRLTLSLTPQPPPATTPFELFLADDAPLRTTAYALARAMLQREIVHAQGGKSQPASACDWLAAALTFRVLSQVTGDFSWSVRNRFMAQELYGRRIYLNLESVLETPAVPPAWRLPFELYARHCHLLLGILEQGSSRRDNRFAHLLVLLGAGRKPVNALSLAFAQNLEPGQTVQLWYQAQCERLAAPAASLSRASLERLVTQVQDLETVPVVGPGKHGTFDLHRVRLDELDGETEDYARDHAALVTAANGFLALYRQAPWFLRPALNQYAQAAVDLEAGRTRKAKAALKAARKAFAAALHQQTRLTEWMDSLEAATRNRELQWEPVLAAYKESEAARRALAPGIHAFLDGLER